MVEHDIGFGTICCRGCGQSRSQATTLVGLLEMIEQAWRAGWRFRDGFWNCPQCKESEHGKA
jgi:hypothetical protein